MALNKLCLLLCIFAFAQIHGAKLHPRQFNRIELSRDLAADVASALVQVNELEADRVALNASVQAWNNTYFAQGPTFTQTLSLLATVGIAQADIDALRAQADTCTANTITYVANADSKLRYCQDLLADISWDLENNYLDDLSYDNDLLRTNVAEINTALDDADTYVRGQVTDMSNKIYTLLGPYNTPEANQARALTDQMSAAIDTAAANINTSQATFNVSATEAIDAVQIVADQVPVK